VLSSFFENYLLFILLLVIKNRKGMVLNVLFFSEIGDFFVRLAFIRKQLN